MAVIFLVECRIIRVSAQCRETLQTGDIKRPARTWQISHVDRHGPCMHISVIRYHRLVEMCYETKLCRPVARLSSLRTFTVHPIERSMNSCAYYSFRWKAKNEDWKRGKTTETLMRAASIACIDAYENYQYNKYRPAMGLCEVSGLTGRPTFLEHKV